MAGVARKFIPLFDRVLIQRAEPQLKSAGGILLPESAVEKLNEGRVVAVGPGATHEGVTTPCAVKEGDTVMLPEFGGTTIKLDDKDYLLYRDADLLGVFQ